MSHKLVSSDLHSSQDESAQHGASEGIALSTSERRASSPFCLTGSKPAHLGLSPGGTPHRGLAPSLCFTLLDEGTSQNRDGYRKEDRDSDDIKDKPTGVRGRTMSHPNSLFEGRASGQKERSTGSSGFLQPMSAMQPLSGSSPRARSVRSFSTSTSVLPKDMLSLPLSVTRSKRRSSVGGQGPKSSGERSDTEQPGFFNLGEFDNLTRNDSNSSDSSDSSQSDSSNAPSGPSPSRSLSAESMGSSNSVPFEPPPPPPPSLCKEFTGHFSKRVIKRHLKFMLALYLSSALTLIRPVAIYLGPTPFLANITVVFMHPARTVGSQLEVTVFSVVGALLATASILLCQLATASYNQKHGLDGSSAVWAIEAAWFFIGIWIMTTLKARYAKLSCTFLIFTIAHIFAHSKMHKVMYFNIHAYLTLIGPMMAGVGICLLVSIFCWPETASEGLGRALNESLDTSRTLLDLSTRSFLLHHKTIALPKSVLENAQDEVKKAQKKLYSAYREARYEVTFSRTDPADYKEVRVVVSALMRHLGSMSLVVQNERLLMLGHPDRDDDDLLSGETPDSESNGSDSDSDSDSDNPVVNQDTQSLKDESHHPLHRPRSRRSLDERGTSDADEYCRRRGSADEVRRVRQLLLRAQNSTDFIIQARLFQQEKNKSSPPSMDDSQTRLSSISRTGENSISSRRESGRKKRRSAFERPYSSATASVVSSRHSLKGSPKGLDAKAGDSSQPVGTRALSLDSNNLSGPNTDQDSSFRYDNPNIGQSIEGGLTKHQIREAAEKFKEEKKKQKLQEKKQAAAEKKRLAKKEDEEAMARAMPPKEVAFGDRRLFMSFLDIVRDPLQRLSDSCSRVIVSMEKEIVEGLNVEQDRLERIRRRNAQREDIIRKAEAAKEMAGRNNGQPTIPLNATGLASSGTETIPAVSGDIPSGPRNLKAAESWAKVRTLVKIKQRTLTQEELDYADAIRGNSDRWRKERVSENRDENAGGPLQQSLRRRLSWIGRRQEPMDNEDQYTIPEHVSSVKYLTDELERFDRAEADGLRVFIANHPTLDVGPREEIFLIFFFMFALREIARELLHLSKHVEELHERQKKQMEKEGRKSLRKKLWWPKVVGNFWRWFSWGSYSQARNSEGYSGMIMNQKKNLERSETRLVEDERVRVEAKAAKLSAAKAKEEEDAHLATEASTTERARQTSLFFRPRRSMTISSLFPARRDSNDLEHGLRPPPQREQPIAEPLPISKRRRSKTFMPEHIHQDPAIVLSDHHNSSIRSPKHYGEQHSSHPNPGIIRDRRLTVVDIPEFGASARKKHDSPPNITTVKATTRPRDNLVPLLRLPTTDDVDDADDSESDDSISNKAGPRSGKSRGAFSSGQLRSAHLSDKTPLTGKQESRLKQQQAPSTQPLVFGSQKPKTLRYKIWEAMQPFKSDELKYGFKMALALTFIGLWAWLEWNSAVLATDRGQWAMMTVMAVLSPTIGATFRVCAIRIAGTLVGVGWAMLTYLAYPQNPYVICAMMIFITFAVAFFILESKHPVMGVIMMLSYSSVTFGVYHGTMDTMLQVSYKRTITVTLGILISVVLNTFLWPVLARRELRKEIALLIGRQGVLFAELVNKFLLEVPDRRIPPKSISASPVPKQDVAHGKHGLRLTVPGTADVDGPVENNSTQGSLSGSAPQSKEGSSGASSLLTTGSGRKVPRKQYIPSLPSQDESQAQDSRTSEEDDDDDRSERDRHPLDPDQLAFQHVEHQLQTRLIKIGELLELSASEPRLKEDFPMKLYKQIVQCCQNILDRMISMRMAAQLLSPEVRELVTGPMNYYRRDMVGALLLYFSVLSSSLASKTPLPPYLPSARMARLRVIYNVHEAITAHQAKSGEDHYTYIYYYAFSSALEEVIEELELLAILIKPLVGITFLTSKDILVCGDQLSLRSAIGSVEIGVGPSEPYHEEKVVSPNLVSRVPQTGMNLELGYSIVRDPGVGPLDHPMSPQEITEQQLMEQQINLQNQQQQQLQNQHPLTCNIDRPSLAQEYAPEEGGSPLASHLVDIRLEGLRIVTDPFDPLQTGAQTGSPLSTASNSVAAAAALIGSPTGPILTSPSTASPILIMDQRVLGSRHAQRYKDALQLAQVASGEDDMVLPPPFVDALATTGRENTVTASRAGASQDSTPAVGSVLSPTLSLKKRLIQRLAPSSPLRKRPPLSPPTEQHLGISACPPLAEDMDDEKEEKR
ncbi:hypothetical protein EMPS_04325 [Entomortierella parvispora]|uniref:ER transporter 6TM N-terminal domain-containing protein n=1 Tax=Entomortierella parvispora TaxID=205924 RepID=A0A9P3H8V7_9FUNG|nr:hypothetical protein EMPS_04325 [Entomortierella parvispora]